MLLLASGPCRADSAVPVPEGYRQDDYRAPVPDSVPGGVVLHLEAMRQIVVGGAAVLVDVLPAPRRPESMRSDRPWLPVPHQTLPGAIWWPEVGRGDLPPEFEAHFEQRLREVTAGDANRLVVFFCLSDCWMSWNAARRAASLGMRAGWFPEGVDGWLAAGYPTAAASPIPPEQ